ncbi:uncharacterized protein DFL_008462 [Arthrobotrys flagrans]|uniref:Amino acid permease/ SLC12A domain-containing protein n=1 Tax=Arthrobotrys flagrans TaxID=97331 RepID=A0A436ZNU1_ARTFL|nr:hypothetical protein DFL_008462 [Arthrobotrys flagrans]
MSGTSSPGGLDGGNVLKRLSTGNKREDLPKNLSMVSIMGLSFAIMAVPCGLSTTLSLSLTNGESVTVIWGWVLVSLISMGIAASLAEICAVYPTAGGVYYWSAMLSTPRYRAMASWITGWLTLVGNWTVTLSIAFSTGQLFLSGVSIFHEDFVANTWQTVLMFWGVMAVCTGINAFFSKHLNLLNTICMIWTAAAVLIILVVLLATTRHRNTAEYVFAHYDPTASGYPSGWSFFVGLLQAAYTLTGYGMVASLCEEVQNPEKEVPKAMVLSVFMAGLTGVAYLVPLLFVLPEVKAVLNVANGQPIGMIFTTVTGSKAGGMGLLILVLVIALFAGTGALTAASRCTFAFARDGAIPGSRYWSQYNYQLNVPLNGLLLSSAICCALGLIYFGSTAAFQSFVGVATICLSTSYGFPILVNILNRRVAVKNSSFSLGKFGYAINIVTVTWIILSVVLFCMPVSIPVTAAGMNYASVVFMGFAGISVVWYAVRGRKTFNGPEEVVIYGESRSLDEETGQEKSSK